jgi:ADP-ribose pyrophosphatase YjhB (NUDIX family)
MSNALLTRAIVLGVTVFIAMLTTHADQGPPTTVFPDPALLLTKDTGTNEVVLSWTATQTPYVVTRNTSPDFFGIATPQVVGAGIVGTTFRDPVLNDGITYFYLLDDGNAPPQALSITPDASLAGASVTITGTGFDTSAPSANQVYVGGVAATVTAVTSSSLTFVTPTESFSGFVVSVNSKGASDARKRLTKVVTDGLAAISSLGVDNSGNPFVSDTGTSGTSDRVFTFDPNTGTRTQRGFLGEAVGLGVAGVDNKLYYGNSTTTGTGNFGSIETTNASGSETFYRACGNSMSMPADNCYPFAIGLDPTLLDFGSNGRVYVADGAPGKQKVRIVPPDPGAITDFATGFNFGTPPRGIAVDLNGSSSFFNHIFVSDSTSVKRFSGVVPGVLQKTYNASNSPILDPRQLAITQESSGPGRSERLLIADSGQDRVIILNPATDKARFLDIALTDPRAIAPYKDTVTGKSLAYVGESTRVVRVPVLRTVNVVPWVAVGSNISDSEVRLQIQNARAVYENCGFDVHLVDDKINRFDAGALLDLNINDWTAPGVFCGPTLQRTQEEAALLSRRGPEQTDLNIYFVRRFTVNDSPDPGDTVGETITSDCFQGLQDGTESGLILSVEKLRLNSKATQRTVAHEIGHALLHRLSWPSFDEHSNPLGMPYAPPNMMSRSSNPNRHTLDGDQCQNINNDQTLFRADP